MTENWVQFVETGVVILALLGSFVVALQLRRDAEKHEHSAQILGEKIKRAINL